MNEKFTYKDLKNILSTLTDEQLENQVVIEIDETFRNVTNVSIAENDLYCDSDADYDERYVMPIDELIKYNMDLTPEDCQKCYSEGQLFLQV